VSAPSATAGAASLHEYAITALDADLAVVRVKEDGTKYPMSEPLVDDDGQPILKDDGTQAWGWGHRIHQRATHQEIESWFGNGRRIGFGLICGKVSGRLEPPPEDPDGEPRLLGLEMVEWEQRERYDDFKDVARDIGMGDLVEWIESGYLSATPGGGVHTLIR